MNDIDHFWGGDISASSGGGLMPVSGSQRGIERILRRLMTNPGDYPAHPEYGAGLPGKIGSTFDAPSAKELIRGQMLLEDAVAKTPEPTIDVQQISNGLACNIQYVDAATNTTKTLSFNVNA